jgi:negative regulator of flagellin synthesis FlgM
MKISQPSDNPVAVSSNAASLAAKSGPTASTLAKTGATKSTQSAGIAVTVSTLARSMEATNAGDAPEVDMGKVNAVRNAIAEGTYVVNPEVIADKLLSNAQEMLQRNRA